jgi:hypothetical protein
VRLSPFHPLTLHSATHQAALLKQKPQCQWERVAETRQEAQASDSLGQRGPRPAADCGQGPHLFPLYISPPGQEPAFCTYVAKL